MTISGIFPALVTPFEPDGAVSLRGVRENIRRYNQTAVAGCVVLGSTGESVMLSREAADSTSETIARTRRAADLGYAAALVKTPYYYKPVYKAETFIRHYRAVADASPIPVLLYSVPQFTGITLETPEILTLAAHPNIVGIKDSSGNIQRVVEIVAGANNFQMLTGSASVVFPSLSVGATGAILALGSAFPEKCVALYQLFRQKMYDQALELQGKLAL